MRGELLAKFRVGDIIVGNEKANVYSITRQGAVCEVLRVLSERTLKVRCGRYTFLVEAHCFDIVENPLAEEDDAYDKFLLSYGLG